MNKTRKCISSRFKTTGTGKLMRRKPAQRHRRRFLSQKQRRDGRKDRQVPDTYAKQFKAAMRSG